METYNTDGSQIATGIDSLRLGIRATKQHLTKENVGQ